LPFLLYFIKITLPLVQNPKSYFMTRVCFLFALLFAITSTSFSQKYPFKFGKVSEEEMNLEKCEFYPEATSMVLAEYGDLSFIYNDNDGWKYKMDVAVRKKIFKITDADQGNVKIRVYQPEKGTSEEEINSLKAFVYNIVNGKIEKEKLSNDEKFTTRLSENWVEVSFAIPNIKEGSVIEYSYTKVSDYITNLATWYFQSDIPTAHSEFRFLIPEYFNYQLSQQGNVYSTETERDNRPQTFTYKWETTGKFGQKEKGTGTWNSASQWQMITMKDVPPMEEEPYMNNRSDIPSRLQFQLVTVKMPNSPIQTVAGDYSKFNNEMLTHSGMGDRIKNGNFVKELESQLTGKNQIEKATYVYNHIANHFSWNEIYTFLASDAGRPAYNKKEGNVAEINLSLIAALKEFGINAYPVILSTRGSGTVHPVYPSYDDFNYVIAGIEIEGKIIFADASTRLPLGMLPTRCRNGNGWMVMEPAGKWINLKSGSMFEETTMLNMEFVDGAGKTHVTQRKSGYSGYNAVRKIKASSEEEYSESLSSSLTDASIENLKLSELSYDAPVNLEYDIINEDMNSDILYIQPMLTGAITENPFKRESRMSPIDFAYSQSYRVIAQITVPEGYTAELPQPAAFRLPENGGSFSYNVSQNGDKISVISTFNLSKSYFSVTEYPTLKQFYQLVADKNQEVITLKK
jgi:hypothetical protein